MKKLIVLISFFVIVNTVFAQTETIDPNNKDLWWINIGFGKGGMFGGDLDNAKNSEHDVNNLSLLASSSFYSPQIGFPITVRTAASAEQVMMFTSDIEYIYDYGVLIGQMHKTRWGRIVYSAGISTVKGMYIYGFEDASNETIWKYKSYETIGMPLQVELIFTPIKYIGVGITGYGNLNLKRSFWGAAVCFQFGVLN